MTNSILRRIVCFVLPFAAAAGASGQDVAVDPLAVDAAREAFIERMVETHAFDESELTAILGGARIDGEVLRLISNPAERVVPWYEYREIFLNAARIEAGADFWRERAGLLEAAAARHGVDEPMIVAILGIETLFGQRMGTHRVLDSLATLAFAYPPRAAFFASELESFLLMVRKEGDDLLDALGSYAGAMGAGQFIPSSFRAYAVDANGDGRRDLWADWEDVLGSVANYFAVHGWRAGEPVAVRATLSADADTGGSANRLELNETVGSLRGKGYVFETDLPDSARAMLVELERDADSSEFWVGFNNFYVITRYNRSVKYALAAHQLSRAIDAARRDASQADGAVGGDR